MTDYPRPRIDDAPGLTWRSRASGWEARWQARTDLIQLGYLPKTVRLWYGAAPTPLEAAYISDQCNRLQSEMLVWGRGGIQALPSYDGTLRALIRCFQTDVDSKYQKARFHTRVNYDCICRRLDKDHGKEPVVAIDARTLIQWHREWAASGKISMAHSLMVMIRMLMSFGATLLKDPACRETKTVLSDLSFEQGKSRHEILTAEHANAIRAEAHRRGMHSMALAQAIQFEGTLRQKDVIGEMVPLNEPGVSDVIVGNKKWLRGIRWEEIDDNLILRHITSKKLKEVVIDLKLAPMVMEELKLIPNLRTGPVIIHEKTQVPYIAHQFRWLWREIANAAGVPKAVKNMDSRAGAITEATDAGIDLEHIRHAAAHSDIAITQRYARGGEVKTANVMRLRAEHRNKKGT
jgi:hypothetical protein